MVIKGYNTGLRYSDIANLRTRDVKENPIELKTVDSLIIELNRLSRAILVNTRGGLWG